VSNISFSTAAEAPENEANFLPLEIEPKHFRLVAPEDSILTAERLQWVKDNWIQAIELIDNHAELQLALDSLDSVPFIRNTSLALVSLWGALEALFSPAKTELRFRISALLASYLEEPGEDRQKLHKQVMRLYDERSAAVHGQPKNNKDVLLQTFVLLRNVLVKIISNNHVPSKSELEEYLFCLGEIS
jgi:hypothetical protein